MRLFSSLLKVGISGGALYFAIDQDLFSINQKESIDASKKVIGTLPGLEDYSKKVEIGITKNDVINYWNSGIKTAISALASLPANSKEAFHLGMNYVTDEIKNQMKKSS
uniref:MICOS complex subunit MIC13 n=1 Tax=Parasteatoda tepidariorum TaxID=114398 RepID=A0A2L2Y7U9_PARTP